MSGVIEMCGIRSRFDAEGALLSLSLAVGALALADPALLLGVKITDERAGCQLSAEEALHKLEMALLRLRVRVSNRREACSGTFDSAQPI